MKPNKWEPSDLAASDVGGAELKVVIFVSQEKKSIVIFVSQEKSVEGSMLNIFVWLS